MYLVVFTGLQDNSLISQDVYVAKSYQQAQKIITEQYEDVVSTFKMSGRDDEIVYADNTLNGGAGIHFDNGSKIRWIIFKR